MGTDIFDVQQMSDGAQCSPLLHPPPHGGARPGKGQQSFEAEVHTSVSLEFARYLDHRCLNKADEKMTEIIVKQDRDEVNPPYRNSDSEINKNSGETHTRTTLLNIKEQIRNTEIHNIIINNNKYHTVGN